MANSDPKCDAVRIRKGHVIILQALMKDEQPDQKLDGWGKVLHDFLDDRPGKSISTVDTG